MPYQKYKKYARLNQVLWDHFFKDTKNGNPILYVDDKVLESIGFIPEDFLKTTLMSRSDVQVFIRGWNEAQRAISRSPVKGYDRWNWQNLVEQLLIDKRIGDAPAFFAVACSIMYIAAINPRHNEMKTAARKYLGDDYHGRFGELIDPLFQEIPKYSPEFDPDRAVYDQRHMGKIRYHIVLTPAERDEFIEFIEVNNLQWGSESYADFINERVLPALIKAGKDKLTDCVLKNEFEAYFKDIFALDLEYGKEATAETPAMDVDIYWHYELNIDHAGTYLLQIKKNGYTPFGLRLNDRNEIEPCEDEDIQPDLIARTDTILRINPTQFTVDGRNYRISNVSVSDNGWPETIFMKRMGNSYTFRQMPRVETTGDYLIIPLRNANGKFNRGQARLVANCTRLGIDIPGCAVFRNQCLQPTKTIQSIGNTLSEGKRFVDRRDLYGMGSWYRIMLEDGETLHWTATKYADTKQQKEFTIPTLQGADGLSYFQLPYSSSTLIEGRLTVIDKKSAPVLTERIGAMVKWDGKTTNYHLDGWGEAEKDTDGYMPHIDSDLSVSLGSYQIRGLKDEGSTSMLQDILYELADDKGCVPQQKLVKALDFVLEFNGVTPSNQNHLSLIYAMIYLGYMISYYDTRKHAYDNQLVPAYLEATNYRIDNSNAVLIKGICRGRDIDNLLDQVNGVTKYKRPYQATGDYSAHNPEYTCLPDLVLSSTTIRTIPGWRYLSRPIAQHLIDTMQDMAGFAKHFELGEGADPVVDVRIDEQLPDDGSKVCLVSDAKGDYRLALKRQGEWYTKHTYGDDCRRIPKNLAGLYVQNVNHKPICLFLRDREKHILPSPILFVNNYRDPISHMFVPEVITMALCDLNLGLPNIETAFFMNARDSAFPVSGWTNSVLYADTSATTERTEALSIMLSKMRGERVDVALLIHEGEESSPRAIEVVDSAAPVRKGESFKMKYLRQSQDLSAAYLMLLHGQEMVAFANKTNKPKVWHKSGDVFREVIIADDTTINDVLSQIMTSSRPDLQYADKKCDDIPDYNDPAAKEIKIIKR